MEQKLKLEVLKTIKETFDIDLKDINFSNPPKKEMGDISFNCGILARDLKKNPSIIATELLENLSKIEIVSEVSNENSFINIKIKQGIYSDLFKKLYKSRQDFIGNSELNGKNIVIDYIGANVGKPLHIGHMCTPNIGQVLVNLYRKLGYNVIADSHIGDWGIIFGKLITAYKLWGEEEKLKENAVDYLLELYVKITSEIEKTGEELEQKTRDEFKLLSEGDSDSIELWRKFTSYSIDAMNLLLERLNVKPDFDIGESFYEGLGLPKMQNYPDLKWGMHSVVEELIKKGIATKNEDNSVGVIFEEDLKIPSCILQKKDGTHGYLASDLAAIKYRIHNWNPEKIVYFVDSRQQLHLRQAFLIAENSNWLNGTELFHAYNGFISLKDGAMSTRKGRIIKLDVLLDEAESRAEKIILEKRDDLSEIELKKLSKIIGIGAIKYGYLKKSRETDVIFDWDEFMSFEGNSGPYIQYAYVRALNILNKSNINLDSDSDLNLESTEEIELIKVFSEYQKVLEKTAKFNMPHYLCAYSYDLTKAFNSFYNNISVLNEKDENKKISRLKLVKLFSDILKDSFGVLGIEMPEKM